MSRKEEVSRDKQECKNAQAALQKEKRILKEPLVETTSREKAGQPPRLIKMDWERIFDSVSDLIAIVDTNYNIVRVNRAMAQLLGKTPEESVGLTCYVCVHGTKEPPDFCPHSETLKDEQEHTTEVYEPRFKRFFLVSTYPVKDEHGKLFGSVHVARDITASKQAEEKLKESETRFRLVAEAAKVLVYELDLESGAVTVFRGLEELLGYKTEEVSLDNEWWMNQIHPDDRDATGAKLKIAIETATDTLFEYRIRRKPGDYIIVHDTAKMVKNDAGKVVQIVGGVRDVTERKKAVEQLELQYRILDAMGEAAIATDLQGKIVYWNEFAKRMYGWEQNEVLGRNIVEVTVPEIKQDEAAQIMEYLRRGETWSGEFLVKRRDGTTFPAIVTDAPVTNEKGELIFIMGISLDVTDRKKAEEALRKSEWVARQRAVELEKLQEKLEEKAVEVKEYAKNMEQLAEERAKKLQDAERLATIGATAGMVGHDLRNPLQSILNELYLAKTDLIDMPVGQRRALMLESLENIETEVDYMDKIVQDLQDYAKPLKPNVQETDFEEICQEVLLESNFPENVEVKYVVEEEAKYIVADPTLLKRILSNLVSNAVQAMPDGGKLDVRGYSEGDKVVITVQDSGVGIPEEAKDKLFTPFFTMKAKGQGLGLAVVKRLTEALGGTVTFESGEGKGAKFTVRLPTIKK